MKDFNINRNSWHYRLNKSFLNEHGYCQYSMQRNWEPKVNNFCTYWRVTMFRLLVATILALVCATVGVGFVLTTINNPIGVAVAIGFAISMFAVPTGVALIFTTSSNRLNNSNSLFITKVRSVKNKFCPAVNYEEKQELDDE